MQLSQIIEKLPLVGRKAQQRELFWNLAQHQTDFLYNVAFKYAGNHYDAEDLVQETLYKAYHKFHQLRDRKKFKSWIFTILRRHYLNWLRKHKPDRVVDLDGDDDFLSQLASGTREYDIASIYERKVEAETIQAIMDQLPEKYKTVLILYYMEEKAYHQVAELLEVPIGTVMSRLSRAKQHMKKALLRAGRRSSQSGNVIRFSTER